MMFKTLEEIETVGQVSANTVIKGDCLEAMKYIADKSVDMVLCDLPYGTTACKWDVIIPFEPLWEQYKRIVKPNAAIVLTAAQPFTSQLVMSNPKWFKYEWIWHKTMPVGFLNANRKPLNDHEHILIFGEKSSIYNPQYIPCPPRRATGTSKVKTELYSWYDNPNYVPKEVYDKYYPRTVISFSNGNNKSKHPTQKPVALFEYLIKTYTNEGDLVLDNCAGSGTSAIAALNTNRNYILIEKEDEYFEVIKERIIKHTPKDYSIIPDKLVVEKTGQLALF